MKTALVTGACGFMGSHMVDFLIESDVPVRATDLPRADRTFLNPKAEFVASDLADPASLKGLCDGVDRIFHVAALFSYSASFLQLYRANVVGTRELLKTALRESPKLSSVVLWGAAGVYGPHMKPPVREDAPLEPGNDYLKTKYAQEELAFEFHRAHGLPVTVLRIASPYGPRSRYGAFLTFKMLALGQVPPFLVGDGTNRGGGMIHAADVVAAADLLSRRPAETAGRVFNASDDTAYTVHYISRWLGEQFGSPFLPWPRIPVSVAIRAARGRFSPVPAVMAEYAAIDCVLDTSKLKALGFRLKYPDCKTGLVETIAWYRREGWLPPLEDYEPRNL